MVRHQGIGTAPPANHSDSRRTPGGHGILITHGADWAVNSCMVSQVASMGILLIGVNGYTISNCNVDVCMGTASTPVTVPLAAPSRATTSASLEMTEFRSSAT
ncbi:hypothetical protein MSS93_16390 [Deinococcus radiodurans]|nr:hypothetical protein MSS93_16390 [Deinococcus radiodurans]